MITDTVPVVQPSAPAPVNSAPVDTPITVEVVPIHRDSGKLYEQYLHPSAIQVVKDNGKAPSDLGSLPDHHAVVDTLQATGSYPLNPTLVPYDGYEDFPEDSFLVTRAGQRILTSPIQYSHMAAASPSNRGIKVPAPTPKPTPKPIEKLTPKPTPKPIEKPAPKTIEKPTQTTQVQAPIKKSGQVIDSVNYADFLPVEVEEIQVENASDAELISGVELPVINKPVTGTVTSVENHDIIGLENRLAGRLGLCSYILMKTFPCEVISVSLDKDVVRVTGVDIIDGQIYQGTWDRNDMVPILNILETRYTLDGINGNTLTLKGADSLASQIDIHDEDLKAAMASALEDHRTVLVHVINTMGMAKVNTFEVL